MPTHTVTNEASGEQFVVECVAAPGADLLDPDCLHGAPFDHIRNMTGFQKEWHPHVKQYMQTLGMLPGIQQRSPGAVFMLRWGFDFWGSADALAILQRDTDLEVPRMLWSTGVSGSCSEEGGAWYSRMCIAGSLVTASLIKHPRVPVQVQMDNLWTEFNAINSDDGLFEFMHRDTRRHCMCMQYVSAAAAAKHPQKCGACQKEMDAPKRCSRCKEKWYCDHNCQKNAWKQHKKSCSLRE